LGRALVRFQKESHAALMAIEISLPQNELEFTYVRSSGAGGQNVNKVSSKAVLRWNPTTTAAIPFGVKQRFLERFGNKLTSTGDLIVSSDRHRDQGRNTADCLEKLKEMIASVWFPPKKRKPTKPTYGSKQRRLKSKKLHSEKKQNRRTQE
jgi:ribosome-associated protein